MADVPVKKGFCDLPPEIHLKIIDQLHGIVLLNLWEACRYNTKLKDVCSTARILDFTNSANNLTQRNLIEQLNGFMPTVVAAGLKSLNLSGCYWISSTELVSQITNFPKLQSLFVVETQLNLDDLLVSIFPVCREIKDVSFTLRNKQQNSNFTPDQIKAFENLERLEMMVEDSCQVDDLRFLMMCTNLKKLLVPRSPLMLFNFPFQPVGLDIILRHLESLVFLVGPFPAGMKLVRQFINVEREDSQLTHLWSNVLDCRNVENKNFHSLCWNFNGQRDINIRVDSQEELESVWEPKPLFLQATDSSIKLKSASLYFNGQFWLDFCKTHTILEELKLMFFQENVEGLVRRATPAVWNMDSWSKLTQLRKLHIDASLIKKLRATNVGHQAKRRRGDDGETSVQSNSPPAYLTVVFENCRQIQELEIFGESPDNDPRSLDPDGRRGTKIDVSELSAIALLGSNLEKLTLANLDVENGLFFTSIFKENKNLKSIRLKDIGPSDSCCYSTSLISALPQAKKLETFCIFQRVIPFEEMLTLMGALEACTLLQRVSLVCPMGTWQIGKAVLRKRFVDFSKNLPNLVGLFGHLYAVTDNFAPMNDHLAKEFRTARPAFRADIQCPPRPRRQARGHGQVNVADMCDDSNMQESYRSPILPLYHSDLLCHIPSRVGILPHQCDAFFQHL